MTILEHLKHLLLMDDRPQRAIARHLGVSLGLINGFTNDRLMPSLQTAELIAEDYGYRLRMTPGNYPGDAGDQARALIREQGVCADRIARTCNISHMTASRLVSGQYNIQMRTALAVAAAFGQSWTLQRIEQ